MSPEVVTIGQNSIIDFKTDIWSFGCVLYEIITLQKAFYDESMSTLVQKIVDVNVKIPSSINGEFKNVLEM